MARDTFERQLQMMVDQVLVLGSMVEQAVIDAVEALKHRNRAAAQRIYEADYVINEKRYAIESACVTLIATQQPMARDVRFLAAILEIITELERIADYAKGICKITLLISEEAIDPVILDELQQMATFALEMLQRALDAFVAIDANAARQIPVEDEQVDQLYNRIYRKLMEQMTTNISTVDRANHIMWAAHNLERMGDRVTNICERIVYVATGEMKELDTK
ncbi:MAG: phosphate transport system regulatory protein PhoU [Anaerolineales bacterium]|nr:phosphate signaling complex protein PhoU [Anaerolineae bacterium]PWB55766.1 MAG: phosphate transport system regulatory protein PhoU [Anaerolineales bacterium]